MGEAENIEIIVDVLRKVPAKSLLIIELANQIPIVDGALDVKELQKRQVEINLAIEEAKIYGAHTLQAIDRLVRLRGVGE